MKKFYFSLESLLKYKQQLLEGYENELARIDNNYNQVLQSEKENELKKESTQEKLFQQSNKGVIAQVFMVYTNYYDALIKEEKLIARKKMFAMKEKENQLKKMISIKKEITSLEKIKEKEWNEYQKLIQKQEQIMVEEFVVNKYMSMKSEVEN